MSRIPIVKALCDPAIANEFSEEDWCEILWQARRANVLGRLATSAEVRNSAPDRIATHFRSATAESEACRRATRRETRAVLETLSSVGIPIILLKGAAYEAANLPPASGRIFSDLDLLVPRPDLSRAENELLNAGWELSTDDAYTNRYYREWMHELPPMLHRQRRTNLDVHHTLLPLTSRCYPNVTELWRASIPVDESSLRVLSPEDMVLHSAAHAFHDGDLNVPLRDMFDLHDLLLHFGRANSFWNNLAQRAALHQLERPLFYALRFCGMFLGTPVPDEIDSSLAGGRPNRVTLHIMDTLVKSALMPEQPVGDRLPSTIASAALLARSHWLRMPAFLLLNHTVRKLLPRITGHG